MDGNKKVPPPTKLCKSILLSEANKSTSVKKNSSSRSATYFLKHPMLILVYSTVLKNTLETYSTLFVLRIGAEMKSQKWKVELPHIFALLGLESGSYKPLTLFDVVNPINRCDLPIKTHYPQ